TRAMREPRETTTVRPTLPFLPLRHLVQRRIVPAARMIARPAIAVRQLMPTNPGNVDPEHIALALHQPGATPHTRPRRSPNFVPLDDAATEALQLIPWHHFLNHWDLWRVIVLWLRLQPWLCASSPLFFFLSLLHLCHPVPWPPCPCLPLNLDPLFLS